MEENKKIKIEKDGPYHISAGIPLEKELAVPDENNDPLSWKKGEQYETQGGYSLCRCGKSGNKPFCDGSHINIGFDDRG